MTSTAAIPSFGHIPMPLARGGSAITNVVRDLTLEHAARGGVSHVVMSHNRDGEVAGAQRLDVDYTRNCPREYFTAPEYAVDHVAGALGVTRPYGARLFIPAAEALARARPDVVFLHEGHYAVTALPLLRRALGKDVGLYYYVHTAISRAVRAPELARCLAVADGVVCVSTYMAEHVRQRSSGRHPTLHVVLNGAPAVEAAPKLPLEGVDGTLRLLFVGQMQEHKGAHLLLAALGQLTSPERARVRLRLVGGPVHGATTVLSFYERRLRQTAIDMGLDVDFLGFQPREALAEHYVWAHILATPSIFADPCPLVVLEGMAHGLGVLSTGRGGIREEAGDAGLIVAASAQGIAMGMRSLLSEPTLVSSLSALALNRASRLGWANQYDSLRQVVDSGGSGSRPTNRPSLPGF